MSKNRIERKTPAADHGEETVAYYPSAVLALLSGYQKRIIEALQRLTTTDAPVDPLLQEKVDQYTDAPK